MTATHDAMRSWAWAAHVPLRARDASSKNFLISALLSAEQPPLERADDIRYRLKRSEPGHECRPVRLDEGPRRVGVAPSSCPSNNGVSCERASLSANVSVRFAKRRIGERRQRVEEAVVLLRRRDRRVHLRDVAIVERRIATGGRDLQHRRDQRRRHGGRLFEIAQRQRAGALLHLRIAAEHLQQRAAQAVHVIRITGLWFDADAIERGTERRASPRHRIADAGRHRRSSR